MSKTRMLNRRHTYLLLVTLCLIMGKAYSSEIVRQIESNVHLGAATCATSQCHGKSAPVEGRNVHLDEYTFWIDQDYHSVAYKTLLNDDSKRIAAKLGLESARSAKICLDCHADNVPEDKRGPKFQISDGVGCEACHGGAENWIATHTDANATHAANVKAGLIETEKGDVRAQVCLSCHLGTKDRFATHRIMAAGHPRLSFEMNLFTENQPAHYSVDQDYVERKGLIPGFSLWMTGQFESAKQQVNVAGLRLHDGFGIFPDFAFYDCDSCHHSTNNLRWTRARADGVIPGSLRLHMPNLVVIRSILDAVGTKEQIDNLEARRKHTLLAAQGAKGKFVESAKSLEAALDTLYQQLNREYSADEIRKVRRSLLNSAAADRASDFAEAEQIIYSFETLCLTLGDIDSCSSALDSFYEDVQLFDKYKPRQFSKIAKAISGKF